jgi:fucose 4-O-acetylase-like acetyltransferase
MMQERDKTLDVLRGMGILLVVLGHSIQNEYVVLNTVILSFHMPLFFFCSGCLGHPISRGGVFELCS